MGFGGLFSDFGPKNQRSHFRVPDIQKQTPMCWKIGGDPHMNVDGCWEQPSEGFFCGMNWDSLIVQNWMDPLNSKLNPKIAGLV